MISRFLDAPNPIAFAHRGFAGPGATFPENSMAAFQSAVDLGYRYLETDVRVSADGVALAFHDGSLERVSGRRDRLIDRPWADLRSIRIAGTEVIPRLADVLGTWPDCFVNIDVKSDAAVGSTVDAIRVAGAGDRVCVGAFSDRRLARLRDALGPDVCTALGPAEASRLRLSASSPVRLPPRPARRTTDGTVGRAAQLPHRIGRLTIIDARLVRLAHARGLAVHAWTVNDAADMRALLELGVDGLITDRGDLLRAVLEERGVWPTR